MRDKKRKQSSEERRALDGLFSDLKKGLNERGFTTKQYEENGTGVLHITGSPNELARPRKPRLKVHVKGRGR